MVADGVGWAMNHNDLRTDRQTERETEKTSKRMTEKLLKTDKLLKMWMVLCQTVIDCYCGSHREREKVTSINVSKYVRTEINLIGIFFFCMYN